MRLIGYIRVSTEEQASDGRSLGIQRAQLEKYCDLFGYELVAVVADEGVSASMDLSGREGGAQVLDRLRRGEADGVVIQRLDRMFRLTLDGLKTFAWFDRRGLVCHSVNEKIDTTSPEGKMQLTLVLAMAEYERNKISQRAREVSDGLREQGRAYGEVPYGCMRMGDHLYRDPDTWPIRERIVAEINSGDSSIRGLCNRLKKEGIRAPKGGVLWHASTVSRIFETHLGLESIPDLPALHETGVSDGTL